MSCVTRTSSALSLSQLLEKGSACGQPMLTFTGQRCAATYSASAEAYLRTLRRRQGSLRQQVTRNRVLEDDQESARLTPHVASDVYDTAAVVKVQASGKSYGTCSRISKGRRKQGREVWPAFLPSRQSCWSLHILSQLPGTRLLMWLLHLCLSGSWNRVFRAHSAQSTFTG